MTTPDDHASAAVRARALFKAQVEALDPATTTALRARRREALARLSLRPPTGKPGGRWHGPAAGGLVTAALALVLVAPPLQSPPPETVAPETEVSTPGAMPMAALDEMNAVVEFDEDAAFLLWLGEAPLPPGPSLPLIDPGVLP